MREWVEDRTLSGRPFRYTRPVMPPIPPDLLESVVFVYETETDARAGTNWGACGFLIGVPFDGMGEKGQPRHMYVVTALHVATRGSTATAFTLFWTMKKTSYGTDIQARKMAQAAVCTTTRSII